MTASLHLIRPETTTAMSARRLRRHTRQAAPASKSDSDLRPYDCPRAHNGRPPPDSMTRGGRRLASGFVKIIRGLCDACAF